MLDSAAMTTAAGHELAAALTAGAVEQAVIYLRGELGAGKTTFARGLLEGMGHTGRVPSPTYTLVEPYELDAWQVFHVDLYRLADPGEVEQLGLTDLYGPQAVMLIEWPERGAGRIEPADVELRLDLQGEGRSLLALALTPNGERLLGAAGWLPKV